MYDLIGLKSNPFQVTNDTKYFCPTHEHERVLENIEQSIRQKEGLNVIIGDYGTGKSTVLAVLSERFFNDRRFKLINIGCAVTKKPIELYQLLRNAAGIKETDSKCEQIKQEFIEWAIEETIGLDRIVIIIADEAQELGLKCYDEIAELIEIQQQGTKIFHFLLCGQIPIKSKIEKKKKIPLLSKNVIEIKSLTKESLEALIMYRIKVASINYDKPPRIFTGKALDLIYEYSKGFSRRSLIFCDHLIKDLIASNKERIIDDISVSRMAKIMLKLYGDRGNAQ